MKLLVPAFRGSVPNFNVVDRGLAAVFEIEEVIIEIGRVGGKSAQEVV